MGESMPDPDPRNMTRRIRVPGLPGGMPSIMKPPPLALPNKSNESQTPESVMSDVAEFDKLPAWPGASQLLPSAEERSAETISTHDVENFIWDLLEDFWDEDDIRDNIPKLKRIATQVAYRLFELEGARWEQYRSDAALRAELVIKAASRVEALRLAKLMNLRKGYNARKQTAFRHVVRRGGSKYKIRFAIETLGSSSGGFAMNITDAMGNVETRNWSKLHIQVASTSDMEAINLLTDKWDKDKVKALNAGAESDKTARIAYQSAKQIEARTEPTALPPGKLAGLTRAKAVIAKMPSQLTGNRPTIEADHEPAHEWWTKTAVFFSAVSAAVISKVVDETIFMSVVHLVLGGFAGYFIYTDRLDRNIGWFKTRLRWPPFRAHLLIFVGGGVLIGVLVNVAMFVVPWLIDVWKGL